MAWVDLVPLVGGDLVTQTHHNQINDAMDYLVKRPSSVINPVGAGNTTAITAGTYSAIAGIGTVDIVPEVQNSHLLAIWSVWCKYGATTGANFVITYGLPTPVSTHQTAYLDRYTLTTTDSWQWGWAIIPVGSNHLTTHRLTVSMTADNNGTVTLTNGFPNRLTVMEI